MQLLFKIFPDTPSFAITTIRAQRRVTVSLELNENQSNVLLNSLVVMSFSARSAFRKVTMTFRHHFVQVFS